MTRSMKEKSNAMLTFCIVCLVLLMIMKGSSGNVHDHQLHPRKILLKGRHIDTKTAPQFHEEDSSSSHFTTLSLDERMASPKSATFLLHVSDDAAERNQLKEHVRREHGMHLLEYLPHNTFIVEGTHDTMSELEKRHDVLWVGYLKPDDKLGKHETNPDQHPGFNENDRIQYVRNSSLGSEAKNELVVSLTKNGPSRSESTLDAIADEIRDVLNIALELDSPDNVIIEPVYSKRNRITIKFGSQGDRDRAENAIAQIGAVTSVERREPILLSNIWGRGIIEAGSESKIDLSDPQALLSSRHNLRGQNQVIGISDSGLDVDNCFLNDPNGPSPFVEHLGNRAPTQSDLNIDALNNARKVISYVTYGDDNDSSGHGTHVAGSMAGVPNTDDVTYHEYSGSAPEAKLAFFDLGSIRNGQEVLGVPSDIGSYLLHWAYESGARVHSNSWGTTSAAYTSDSVDMDEYMWEYKDFIVLVAAGNSGECMEKSIGSPSTAKSVIAVGASMSNTDTYEAAGSITPPFFQNNKQLFDEDDVAYFSSIGPTDDGRIKPDVVAPGFGIRSASNGGGSCSQSVSSVVSIMSGTSMATPLLAGGVTIARQYFTEGYFPTGRKISTHAFSPSGSLLKAITIASARALRTGTRITYGSSCETRAYSFTETHVPNNNYGWGRPQLNWALEFADDAESSAFHLHIPSLDRARTSTFGDEVLTQTGSSIEYTFCARSVGSDNADDEERTSVRVVLVWTDAPGSSNAGVALVNDLDLEVEYKGETLLGNMKTTADRLNPVEAIDIDIDSSASDLVVRVRATSINVGSQPFSLIVLGPVRQANCAAMENGATVYDGKDGVGSSPTDGDSDHECEEIKTTPAPLECTTSETGRHEAKSSTITEESADSNNVTLNAISEASQEENDNGIDADEKESNNSSKNAAAASAALGLGAVVAIYMRRARYRRASIAGGSVAKNNPELKPISIMPTSSALLSNVSPTPPSLPGEVDFRAQQTSDNQGSQSCFSPWSLQYSEEHDRHFYWNCTTNESFWVSK